MTEFINNNDSPNLDVVDNSNNCVDSRKEISNTNKLSHNVEEEEEEEYTIRIPFFTLDKYKKGLIRKFDEIIGRYLTDHH